MTEVISVKFKNRGKPYFFDPKGITLSEGEAVIVETTKGIEFAYCSASNHYVADDRVVKPLMPVVRRATPQDIRVDAQNRANENNAVEICKEKVKAHGLDMKIIGCEYSFEGNKITFFFTSEGRVDFRDLVKDLAAAFRVRIELRQVGVRDETKLLGGIGMCGRPFCCSLFLDEFAPVSTKMAKQQALSLNPTKISGVCGRLMCCLRYEAEAYEELNKSLPKIGAFVETYSGYGTVAQTNVLRQLVKVKLDDEKDGDVKFFNVSDIAVVPGGRPAAGEPLPSILERRPRPEVKTEPASEAAIAELASFGNPFTEEKRAEPEGAEGTAQKKENKGNSPRRRGAGGGQRNKRGGRQKQSQKNEQAAKSTVHEKEASKSNEAGKNSKRRRNKKTGRAPNGEERQKDKELRSS